MKGERLTLDEDDSNNYSVFLFSCLVHLSWTSSKKTTLISSIKNLRMPFRCQRKGLMKFWCGALRCMVNGDAGKLTLSLLNRLQSAERSLSLSLSLFLLFLFNSVSTSVFPSLGALCYYSFWTCWLPLHYYLPDSYIGFGAIIRCSALMVTPISHQYFFFLMKWQLLRFNIKNYC